MNQRSITATFAVLLAWGLSVPALQAQQGQTTIGNAEVVYVQGSDVVVRLANGEVRQLEFPDSSRFVVDGRQLTVHELKQGMTLGEPRTTVVPSRSVDTVETMQVGTVWKTIGNTIIIKTTDGVNKLYRVPSGSRVTIDGKEISLEGLREGDNITATIVKLTPPPEASNVPPHIRHTPATPPQVGMLLIDEGAKPAESHGMKLETTIVILVVVLLVAGFFILREFRRRRKG